MRVFLIFGCTVAGGPSPSNSKPNQKPRKSPWSPPRPVAREGVWIVFNQVVNRDSVIEYFWGRGLTPTSNELYSRASRTQQGDLVLPDTHWQLAASAVAARQSLYQRMRPEARRQLDRLPTRAREPVRPDWVPAEAWQRCLSARNGVHAYFRASRFDTDIILIRRMGRITGGYAEAPSNVEMTSRLLGVTPASTWQRVCGGETSLQAAARWAAGGAEEFNLFLSQMVSRGVSPADARERYRQITYRQYAAAFIPLLGFSVPASHAAGEQAAAAGRMIASVASSWSH